MDVPGEKLPSDLPAYLRERVASDVPEQLRSAFLEALESGGQIRAMQNSQVYSQPLHQPGIGYIEH